MTRLTRYTKTIVAIAAVTTASALTGNCYAQKYPERRITRQGNRAYDKGDYAKSEVDYRKAIAANPSLYEADFNLGDAVFKQERYDEAEKTFARTAADTTRTDEERAASLYNKGNAQFKQRNFGDAVESFKASLRLRPDDKQCKFNLAYAQKMLEQQQQQNEQNKDNKDNQQNQDKQNKDNQNKDDQNKDDQNKDNQQNQDQDQQNKDNPNKDDSQGNNEQPQPQGDKPQPEGQPQGEPQISPEEAQQLLQAIQGEEDKTRDKLDKQRAVTVGRSGKNW